ncbi:hypothetical protein [Cryobacterium psychrophilum]|nr:hypothetical protein [Cryobacterium psychrophilum]
MQGPRPTDDNKDAVRRAAADLPDASVKHMFDNVAALVNAAA